MGVGFFRHYQDSDASMTLSDAEIYKHKKKKKKKKKHAKRSEGFFEHADPHAQKQGNSEMNRTWEKKEDSDLTDDTPVEEHGRHGYERLHEEDANSSLKKKCLEGGKENSYPVSREDSKGKRLEKLTGLLFIQIKENIQSHFKCSVLVLVQHVTTPNV